MSNSFQAPKGPLARTSMEYARHQPEHTLLYQVIEEYYPSFMPHLSELEKSLPQYVQDEFESYLKCGRQNFGAFESTATTADISPSFIMY